MNTATAVKPVGVILAGGLARRMGGGDKPLRHLAGKPILAHVMERIRPQVARLILNANGDPARFASWGLPVVADPMPDFPGPLAGVLAGMRWAAANAPEAADILTIPGDTPFLPRDLVERLVAGRSQQPIACARSGDRIHPVIALWPVRLADDLAQALTSGTRKILAWAEGHGLASVVFDTRPVDPFFNVNHPEDLAAAAQFATEL
jgi:molybdenum cofactor guanylyltransferase